MDYINNLFWLLSSIFDIMVTVVEISHLQKQIKKVANQLSDSKAVTDDATKQSLRQELKELRILLTKQYLNFFRENKR